MFDYAQTYSHYGTTHFSFNSSLVPRPRPAFLRLQSTESWAGPGNEATSTVEITHLCQLLYQEFDARMAYIRGSIYYQKQVVTMKTVSDASERIKAYSCIAPSAARDGDMLSV